MKEKSNSHSLSFQDIFGASGLPEKLGFTLLMLAIYRLGVHIPLYGVDHNALKSNPTLSSGLLGLVDMFAGGALSALSIFALGIGPYITSSIILQLLTEVVPALKDMQRNNGDEGRKQFQKITRYSTLILAVIQSFALARFLDVAKIATSTGSGFYLTTVLVLAVSSLFIMWLGETITEKGIGNGASLLIFIGIASKMPVMFKDTATAVRIGSTPQWGVISLALVFLALTVMIICIQEGSRNLLILGAKQGRATQKGHFLPLKINPAGVLPIIFSSAVLFMPIQLLTFAGVQNTSVSMLLREWFAKIPGVVSLSGTAIGNFGVWLSMRLEYLFSYQRVEHSIAYFVLIVAFAFFYATIVTNPRDMAENLKKGGSAIEGIKPGKATTEYLEKVLSRIVLIGAVAIGLVAVLPIHAEQLCQVKTLGGLGSTSLLILVGVAIDTRNQLLSYVHSHRYQSKSLLKRG
ncbi:MAG: preprotein translocase subunit SecY [Candidatus Caenarcaniphilales bacterium]|jgi:preprotein translocase subunit SecY|nr:preprotein translocase subunit SecY [Candidatus Caenarcaniphilales bacterium]